MSECEALPGICVFNKLPSLAKKKKLQLRSITHIKKSTKNINMQYKLLQSEHPYNHGLGQEREPCQHFISPFQSSPSSSLLTTILTSNTISLILAFIENGNQSNRIRSILLKSVI